MIDPWPALRGVGLPITRARVVYALAHSNNACDRTFADVAIPGSIEKEEQALHCWSPGLVLSVVEDRTGLAQPSGPLSSISFCTFGSLSCSAWLEPRSQRPVAASAATGA